MWDSDAANSGTGTLYDVLRGSLSEFPVGSGGSETCLDPHSGNTHATDGETPTAGNGFYYLVRGFNACGTGTYGFTTDPSERSTATCP